MSSLLMAAAGKRAAGGGGAFPTFVGVGDVLGYSGSSTTNHDVDFPAHLTGDRLLVAFVKFNSQSITSIADIDGESWSEVLSQTASQTSLHIYELTAGSDDGDGGTFEIVIDGNIGLKAATIAYRGVHAATPAEAAAFVTTGTTPDPPSLTPSWGSGKTSWLTGWVRYPGAGLSNWVSNPADYTERVRPTTVNASGRLLMASRDLETDTENPGAGEVSDTGQYITYTVGLRAA